MDPAVAANNTHNALLIRAELDTEYVSMCVCVCVCGHCILAGIIGDLDLFYCTVFIYLRLLTWLCLLPCYCICIALSIPCHRQ